MFTKAARTRPAALRAFAEKNGLELAAICFMGDDVNDLSAMELAGFGAAPANAQPSGPRAGRAWSRSDREATAPCVNLSICS